MPLTVRLKLVLIVALTVLYPFHSSMVGFNVSLGDLVVALILVPIALGAVVGQLQMPRYAVHALAFLGVATLTFFANAQSEGVFFSVTEGSSEMLKFVAAVSWMVAIFWLLRDNVSSRLLLFAVVSVLLGSIFASWSIVENIGRGVGRPTGPFENPNIYGNYLVFTAVLLGVATTLIRDGRLHVGTTTWHRWWQLFLSARLALFPILILGILATGSRGAMLSALTALVVAVRLRPPRRLSVPKLVIGVVGLAIAIGSITWFVRQDPHMLRRIEGAPRGEGPNIQARLTLWDAAIKTFAAEPVLGVGYGQFPVYSSAKFGLEPHVVHQTYLSTAAETGLIGVLILGWLLLAVLRDTKLAHRALGSRVPILCRAFVLATCVQGLVANVEQFRAPWLMFGIVAALALQARMLGDSPAPWPATNGREADSLVGAEQEEALAAPARRVRARRRF